MGNFKRATLGRGFRLSSLFCGAVLYLTGCTVNVTQEKKQCPPERQAKRELLVKELVDKYKLNVADIVEILVFRGDNTAGYTVLRIKKEVDKQVPCFGEVKG